MPMRKKLNQDLYRIYGSIFAILLILEIVFLVFNYKAVDKQLRTEAKAVGEEIAARIQSELQSSFETTELIKDLYSVYGDNFLKDFDIICEQLTKDKLAIGSMYFAPKAVIKYGYPDAVDSSTNNFEMLKDPVQGPKAQKAIDDRLPTIAGPHNLIEGGQGLIIRNPIFKDGEFIAFSIIVVDRDQLIKKISADKNFQTYEVAVWKDDDPTAITDRDGFIYKSIDKSMKRDALVTFSLLNDTWYLTLEPTNGWNVWENMGTEVTTSLIGFFLLVFLFYMHMISTIRKRRLQEEIFASKAKSSFLFSMSHDIRTPMNAIIGLTDLLKKNLDNRQKLEEYLEKLNSSSNFLLSLINNVLEMARIESGKIVLEENIIDTQLFEQITDNVFGDFAKKKGIRYSNDYKLIHDFVIGDETKVREITLNIVSNAIKYTPAGGYVKLSLVEEPCDRQGYTMFTAISEDSGCGISEEYLPHIFEEFSRERTSTESHISGTGLGMPIVKKLLDLIGGEIHIESKLGQGTKVTIKVPLRIPTPQQEEEARKAKALRNESAIEALPQKNLSGKRILLAEDNDLNAEIAIALLEELDLKVDRVGNGKECLDTLETSSTGYYDLILMDIQMPVMDGYEATKSIRNLSNPAKATIPIVAMTANAFEEDRNRAFEAGMNGHVAKPIDVSLLVKALIKNIPNTIQKT